MKEERNNNLFVTLFLPLGDQVGVGVVIFEQPAVERFRDGFFLVIELVNISRPCHTKKMSNVFNVQQR